MKKIYMSILVFCAIICSGFIFTGCGEQFIIEQDYQLLGMQVVVDNTEVEGYVQYQPGTYVTNLSGNMKIVDCVVSVKKTQLKLIWTNSGVTATFVFDINSKQSDYPTYTYASYQATYNGTPLDQLDYDTIIEADIEEHISSVMAFDYSLKLGETRIQIVTQSQSLVALIDIVNVESKILVFKSELYGISFE